MKITQKKDKNEKSNYCIITEKDFEDLDVILNKIRVYLNSGISIKDSTDGSIIIQVHSDLGIIKGEVKAKSIKKGVEFLINKIY